MVALRIATLWLALIAWAMAVDTRGDDREFQVIVDDLEVMTEPSDSAYSTGTLGRGDRVVVLSKQRGWATIRPPSATFDWVNAAQVRDQPDGSCMVLANSASVRYAADSAKMPGPPCGNLKKGSFVRLLDHPELKTGRGENARVWRAIEPVGEKVRYLRLDGLEVSTPNEKISQPQYEPPERLVSNRSEAPEPDLPAEVNAELVSIAASVRSIKSGAVERWDLGPIRVRYESLIRQFGDNPSVRAVVQRRLDQIVRDIDLSKTAQRLTRLLQEGDDRDAEVARLQRSLASARSRTERKYDAQGLLQPSSRRYQGQKVHALIGPEGRPISYLTIPPGVPINQFLAKRVGVRGIVHFDAELGARLISVRDLEVIEKNR